LFYFRSVILEDHEDVKKKCAVINNTKIDNHSRICIVHSLAHPLA
jgi:hypothetical protein